MHFTVRVLASALLLVNGCTHVAAQRRNAPRKPAAAQAREAESLSRMTERASIVPRVDHHQHTVGPRASIPWPPLAPAADLPPGLGRVIQERNRITGAADVGNLYTDTARIVDVQAESQPWVRGRDAILRVVNSYKPVTRFVAHSFALDDSVAHVGGVAVTEGAPESRMNFVLGLKKDERGIWRIDTEQAAPIPPPPTPRPRRSAGRGCATNCP